MDMGAHVRAAQAAEFALALAPQSGDPALVARMHRSVARTLLAEGRIAEADASLAKAAELYRTLQIRTEIRVQIIVKVGAGDTASALLDLWRGKVRQAIGTYSDEAAGVESVVYNRTDPPGRVTEEALRTLDVDILAVPPVKSPPDAGKI